VGDYTEANTRFLLQDGRWRGLVLDSSEDHIARLRTSDLYWRHDLIASPAWVTAENINDLVKAAGISGDIGLLHIDVDGNDYWIWKALEVIAPRIAILEYNSVFGWERAITIPYDPKFDRQKAHYNMLYFGASLPALCDLATAKGYSFVGSNSAGNNAYFVRQDCLGPLRTLSAKEGYVESQFRESRSGDGKLSLLRGAERLEAIRGLKVYNTRTQLLEDL
jgi:hypothetical protein